MSVAQTERSLFEALAESVGPLAQLPNNGAKYHTGEQIVTHLNRVLGPESWSFRVIATGEEADSDECWAFCEITAVIGGVTVVKQDYGSQAFKRTRETGKYVSKWDDKKAAMTDALKRCARLLGVGLDAWANERAPSWRPESDDPADAAPKAKAKAKAKATATETETKDRQPCDAAAMTRAWDAAVAGTRFADDDTRHQFLDWYTKGAYQSLSAFLAVATTEEAEALVRKVAAAIVHKRTKAAAS